MTGRPCILCSRSLEEPALDTARLTLGCECGVVYSAELVERSSAREWFAVWQRDGYHVERVHDQVVVTRL